MPVTACTIVARNYLAQARVMAASFTRYHPDGEVVVLLVDDEDGTTATTGEPFTCVRLHDIGLGREEVGILATAYDVLELSTAVKPALLRWLLAGGLRTHAVYLDPDVKIFDRLDPMVDEAYRHATVVVPHTTAPVPDDGKSVTARQILAAGVYNLGCIAVTRPSGLFLDWWWQCTRRQALNAIDLNMFTDQRWVDLLPGLFEHGILREPGYNVAYWNLHAQPLTRRDGRYWAGASPLRFFHFSGFDYRRPYLLSRHQGDNPRVLLSEHPALARICAEYRQDLLAAGIDSSASIQYGWSRLPSGLWLDPRIRRLYWHALIAHERDGTDAPPNPFVTRDDSAFLHWLREPAENGRPGLGRYLEAVYLTRPDLQQAFPGAGSGDTAGLLQWARWVERYRMDRDDIVPDLLVPHPAATPAPGAEGVRAVTLTGYLRAASGVGEAGRRLRAAFAETGEALAVHDYASTVHETVYPSDGTDGARAPGDINLVCVNADQLPRFAAEHGPAFFEGRHTIGYWFWELERFPRALYPAFAHVDEVWAATDFTANALRACQQKPVYTVPIPLPVPQPDRSLSRAALGLPDGFVFLFCFDFLSVAARKNPLGLVAAFRQAFQPDEGPTLVIKSMNGHRAVADLEALRAAAAGYTDVRILDGTLPWAAKDALIAHADCYCSLHRSEGLGLTMAEAMALGTPVIATRYSGNLAFMSDANSFLVDCTMGETPPSTGPYPAGVPWAEPNLAAAARAMRTVYDQPVEAKRRAERGRHDIMTLHSPRACARGIAERIAAIRALRSPLGRPLAADVHT
jgi:glycosyltransferase involved in cell wall biosynthesis